MSEQQAAVLAFEARWWQRAGAKEEAIRTELGLTAVRYYQLLNRLLDDQAALAADPVLVHRLRRIRDARLTTRQARRRAS